MQFRNLLHEWGIVAAVAALTLLALSVAYRVAPPAALGIAPAPPLGELGSFYAPQQAPGGEFRWSEPQASLNLPRPGQQALVTLELSSGEAAPVEVRVRSADGEQRFLVEPAPRRYEFTVTPNALDTRLKLEIASAVAVQTSADNRLRGVVLHDLAIRGDGQVPLGVALVALLAAITSYNAVRLAGAHRWFAVFVSASGSIMLATAIGFGGWQIWWLPEFRLIIALTTLGALLLDRVLRRQVNDGTRWHILVLCLLTLPVRFAFVPQADVVGDQSHFFVPWALWAHDYGWQQLYGSGTDYPPLWPLALGGLVSLAEMLGIRFSAPLPPPGALLLKLPAILADLALVLLVYVYARRWRTPLQALGIAAVAALLPPLWITSAWWGQIDSLPMVLVILALLLWNRNHGVWSCVLFTLALLLKFQAVVFAPLLGLLLLRRHGLPGVLKGGAAAMLLAAVVLLPLLLAGQAEGLVYAYTGSVDRYPFLTLHAYNLWALVSGGAGVADFSRRLPGINDHTIWFAGLSYHTVGLLLLGTLTAGVCALLLRRADHETVLVAGALLALGFYLLPTQMHERYVLPVYPLLLLWWARKPVAKWPLLLLAITGTLTLLRSYPLWPLAHTALTPVPVVLTIAVVQLAVFAWLIGRGAILARQAA